MYILGQFSSTTLRTCLYDPVRSSLSTPLSSLLMHTTIERRNTGGTGRREGSLTSIVRPHCRCCRWQMKTVRAHIRCRGRSKHFGGECSRFARLCGPAGNSLVGNTPHIDHALHGSHLRKNRQQRNCPDT